MVREREISSRELTQLQLDRIARLQPELNAFRIVRAEQALVAADAADAMGAEERGPLHGVPVAIKDDVDMAGEVTCHGTNAAGDTPAPADSEVVARLRGAGAILVGKTNVPELEIFPFTETPTFGVTRNPWDPQRSPGGSSGGSAAAVASGMVAAALGSDGGGSIRIPAGCCGLFGIKPQRDRISLAPRREMWNGLSVVGPLTRSVADAALFLDVTATTGAGSFAAAAAAPPSALRIAVSTRTPPSIMSKPDAEQLGAVDSTAELLRSLGHTVFEQQLDYSPSGIPQFLVRYLRGIREDAAAKPHPERLARRTRAMARLGLAYPDALLAKVREAETAVTLRLGAIFDTADVVLTPQFTRRPPPIGKWEGFGAIRTVDAVARWVPYNADFNLTGQPAAAVPAGFASDGFPLAVQLVGRPDDEATLLSLAAQIEAARPWADRRPPVS